MGILTCEIKTQLLAEYQKAAALYSKAVTGLSRQAGTVTRIQYEKLSSETEPARRSVQEARDTLEAHTYEHRG